MARGVRPPPVDVPARIGPVEFGMAGGMVAVRCPVELAPMMRRAGLVGAGHPALADRATANRSRPPPPPAHDRSAVQAGGHQPRRGRPGGWEPARFRTGPRPYRRCILTAILTLIATTTTIRGRSL